MAGRALSLASDFLPLSRFAVQPEGRPLNGDCMASAGQKTIDSWPLPCQRAFLGNAGAGCFRVTATARGACSRPTASEVTWRCKWGGVLMSIASHRPCQCMLMEWVSGHQGMQDSRASLRSPIWNAVACLDQYHKAQYSDAQMQHSHAQA